MSHEPHTDPVIGAGTVETVSENVRRYRQIVPVVFTYDVFFTSGIFHPENSVLGDVLNGTSSGTMKKVLFVIDDGLLPHYPDLKAQIKAYIERYSHTLLLAGEPIVILGGEASKQSEDPVELIHRAVNEFKIDRHSFIVGVGGGAVLDTVGYAAATAHRGVRLVRIPTTVLSQNDSAVGVKNGINAFGKKNFVGTFAAPYAVINDLSFLTTLDDRDWRSGISEAVKVALLKDIRFFEYIERSASDLKGRSLEAMTYLIERCAELHLLHISGSGDPFEMGSSRPLDFGHWSAHKLEQVTGFRLRHGEAVAIGIALDCVYATLLGMLSQADCDRILDVLEAVGFELFTPAISDHVDDLSHSGNVLRGLEEFREHLGGALTIMLLEGIGSGIEVNEVDISLYQKAARILESRTERGVFPNEFRTNQDPAIAR